jgi:hypothetical protein
MHGKAGESFFSRPSAVLRSAAPKTRVAAKRVMNARVESRLADEARDRELFEILQCVIFARAPREMDSGAWASGRKRFLSPSPRFAADFCLGARGFNEGRGIAP